MTISSDVLQRMGASEFTDVISELLNVDESDDLCDNPACHSEAVSRLILGDHPTRTEVCRCMVVCPACRERAGRVFAKKRHQVWECAKRDGSSCGRVGVFYRWEPK